MKRTLRQPPQPAQPGQKDLDLSYDKFIIYIGGNDISEGVPVETILTNILEVRLLLRRSQPRATKINDLAPTRAAPLLHT